MQAVITGRIFRMKAAHTLSSMWPASQRAVRKTCLLPSRPTAAKERGERHGAPEHIVFSTACGFGRRPGRGGCHGTFARHRRGGGGNRRRDEQRRSEVGGRCRGDKRGT